MTLSEFSTEFDILFEDLATSGSKGLEEYEKSICLTYAQESLVRELAQNRVLDPIASLVKENEETLLLTSKYNTAKEVAKVADPFYVLGYFITSSNVDQGDVGLTTVSEQFINDTLLRSPYKYPPKDLAYVVMGETKLIVFPPFSYSLDSVVTRYVEKPTPVILEALTGSRTINGLTAATNPVITSSFHRPLLEGAVNFAVKTYIGVQEEELKDDSKGN